MKVFAIVVTFNGKRWYERCFGSLRNSEMPVETIVIDNASSDDTVDFIKEHFPEVHLIESKENLGFAKANNIGIRYAIDHEADYVFLLNQDAWVEKATLASLLLAFEENVNVGIASPIHLNGNRTGLDKNFTYYMGEEFASDAFIQKTKQYYERPFINAAAWLIGRQCIETVGGFDTSLFKHYGEDDNYCQRVLYHGFSIVVNTRCSICHDREGRKNDDLNLKGISAKTPFLKERVKYGNINVEYDFNRIKRSIKKKIMKSMVMLKFQDSRELKQKLACMELIELSRKVNFNRGWNWL